MEAGTSGVVAFWVREGSGSDDGQKQMTDIHLWQVGCGERRKGSNSGDSQVSGLSNC